jgi:hypothetical protein
MEACPDPNHSFFHESLLIALSCIFCQLNTPTRTGKPVCRRGRRRDGLQRGEREAAWGTAATFGTVGAAEFGTGGDGHGRIAVENGQRRGRATGSWGWEGQRWGRGLDAGRRCVGDGRRRGCRATRILHRKLTENMRANLTPAKFQGSWSKLGEWGSRRIQTNASTRRGG